VYEEANLAVDHNQLIMVVMEKVARRHHLVVLFHEKPFQKVNGSGKHNNWSLATDTGKNLLSPGKTPKTNLQFLTFFINIIKAVNDHADLLRASVATAGNEHRLGANEAPPAIMSAFIGSYMTSVFDDLVKRVKERKMTPDEKTALKLNIGKIPQIILDNTDRNRTSPFAFTGNKFEFRAPGSSANCAAPVIVLNTILAAQLKHFVKEVNSRIEDEANKDEAIFQVLRKYILESKKILFEGNGYSEEWKKEAEKRGLPNIPTVPEALDAYVTSKSFKLFSENEVFTERELQARTDIRLEIYTKVIQLESRMLCDLCDNHIIPTAIRYQNLLMENLRGLREVMKAPANDAFVKLQTETIQEISEHVYSIRKGVVAMVNARKKANAIEDVKKQAQAYCHKIRPMLEEIRYHADKLEIVVDDELWPLTKYREMMFIR
jgi:glutamine synthetase